MNAFAFFVFVVTASAADGYRILDPLAVPAEGDPRQAVVEAERPSRVSVVRCDLVVAGGGMGGVAAALAGARGGVRVCMTEVTEWLGGQMTSQGVSALDENRYIETTGATRTYQELRRRIRAAYQSAPNPGKCWVSALCFEPKVGVAAIQQMLAPLEKSGALRVMLRTAVVDAEVAKGRLVSLLVYCFTTRRFTRLEGAVIIDATELGDLLPLAGAGFRTGADARADTGEPEAEDAADPDALQSFTYPFVLANGGGGTVPARPSTYNRDSSQYNFVVTYPDGRSLTYGMFEKLPGTPGSFWEYRRLVAAATGLSMINWPGNDVCDAGYLSRDPLTAAHALQHGKQVSLGFAWWLHRQAPQLMLRTDVIGTSDGLSQYPYIREARRMNALVTVREQDIAAPWQPGARGRAFDDTAGIGLYAIDIHGCSPRKPLPASKPYQIPMGALISRDVANLLAGGKSIGTTHVTNGAYRLHPTEWAIGEAGGTLAAFAVRHHRTPAQVYRDHAALRGVQRELLRAGHPLTWFDDVTPEAADFFAIQWSALEGRTALNPGSLHARAAM
ncbi:MAG: FAD-dependent oxidoreductase [Candidatus Sulfopaludibacter sp.]|nr:FAD-dependent oxidoreductase [Candidatus Sulfopaludibacter sp.]